MTAKTNTFAGALRLADATAGELSAVAGGHYSLSYNGTGVTFSHTGLVAMKNGEVILELGPGGKVITPRV